LGSVPPSAKPNDLLWPSATAPLLDNDRAT